MATDRHKVFISYCHKDDQYYKDNLVKKTYYNYEKRIYESIFDDYSIGNGDIDDTGMTAEQVRVKIRDEYIQNATVLVLLCGQNTKYRKHVDWEIHAAMYDSEVNPQMGIIVINLPSINQNVRVSDDSEKEIVSPNSTWHNTNLRSDFEKEFPYMPSRIIDNFVKGVSITVVDWNVIDGNPSKLMTLIDNAYKRRNSINYDHSAPLRRNNS